LTRKEKGGGGKPVIRNALESLWENLKGATNRKTVGDHPPALGGKNQGKNSETTTDGTTARGSSKKGKEDWSIERRTMGRVKGIAKRRD